MARQTSPTTAQGIPITPSVSSVVSQLSADVTSWELVQKLLELHPEYGRKKARDVLQREGPPAGARKPANLWLDEVGGLFDVSQVPSLHGRLLILGLCHLEEEKELADYLRGTGFLGALRDELREDFLSLLNEEAAGPAEAYRGKFIRILQNRGKLQSEGVRRESGFLIVAEDGRRLDELAELTQRQTYNSCFTARYVLPTGAGLREGLQSFTQDVHSLVTGSGTVQGDLLPDPASNAWQFLKQAPLSALSIGSDGGAGKGSLDATSEGELLTSLLEAFGRDAVLKTGMRLVLLFEFRGASDGAAPERFGLPADVVSRLTALPERMGMVFSGLPDTINRLLEQAGAYSITLPPDPELTRGLAPSNDVPAGPDLLNIDTEVRALAEAMALKDMKPPLVVGVLGGWGAGKSFVLHLLEERLQEIRCERVPEPDPEGAAEADGDPFPFVGHPYVVRFDAWTYAKGNLWASLMQTIFLELQRQIGLEQLLQDQAGISLREETEIWRVLSRLTDEERERLTRSELGLKALEVVRRFDEGAINERSLWATLAEFRAKERSRLRENERKAASLQRDVGRARRRLEEAVEERIASWKTVRTRLGGRLLRTLRARVENEAKKSGHEVPDAEDLRAAVKWYWKLWLGRGPVFYAFVIFAVAVAAAELIGSIEIPLPAGVASALSGMIAFGTAALKGYHWLEARRADFVELMQQDHPGTRASRDEMIEEALARAEDEPGAAGRAEDEILQAATELTRARSALTTVQAEVEAQRRRAGITARHESLLDFVRQRLEGRYYEDKLGLLHQVQSDLEELSSALLPSRARRDSLDDEHRARLEKLFPRGDPRIILIIDDLDRCPPTKVVQVLEAAQLLVKTPLFVVVLAMDVRYITRALEKEYDRVLVRAGEPSGLDYIEKIIQIPYRVRVITPPVVGGFLSSQMQLQPPAPQETDRTRLDDEAEEEPVADSQAELTIQEQWEQAYKKEGEESGVTPARPVRSELRVLPTRVHRFNEDDHRLISLCCSAIAVSPRAMKRLVNVYKLLKIIWFRKGLTDGPPENAKRAMLALLVMATRYPEVIRQLLRHIEDIYRRGGAPIDEPMAPELAGRCAQSEATAIYPPDWARVGAALLDEKLFPQDLTFRHLEESNFQLVNSFCFVSETDPEREAGLLWGGRYRVDGREEAPTDSDRSGAGVDQPSE